MICVRHSFWHNVCEFRRQFPRRILNRADLNSAFLMPIKLPNLAETQAVRLIACGYVEPKDKSLLSWLNRRRTLISSYSVARHNYFLRVGTGGFSGHFHLE